VGFWAINLPEIPWLLGELALPTQQIKFYISTYLPTRLKAMEFLEGL
jgi:hypothetical protein